MNESTKIAFITGANRGLGFETARGLGKLGILPVLGVRDEVKGRDSVARLKDDGIDAALLRFDLRNTNDHRMAHDYFEKEHGRLDILVNNAGIALDMGTDGAAPPSIETLSADLLHETFETNFFSVVALTQALLPVIKKAPAGRIVNLSSILGSLALHADPASPVYATKVFAYDASKTALNAFTIHLAYALRDSRIKVNSAHPGWVKTDMGGRNAPLEIVDGAKTSIALATLDESGPSGGFFHMGKALPW